MSNRLAIFLLAAGYWLAADFLHAQTPALTTVKDAVYKSDGSLASGTVVISWEAFLDSANKAVLGGTKTVALTNGALAVMLVPNAGGTPSGTSYRVQYFEAAGRFAEERWVVPSSSPLASPSTPTVTPQGTTGSTTYCYWITARNAVGETLLSGPTCITNGNATLDMTNYNQVSWSAVTGATDYRVWRTASSTAPSGTGNYLVGTTSSTSINDQSNSLSSATVPIVNDTDPKTVSQVRVLGVPSPAVVIGATQVQGTAVVQNPSATQTITAPSGSGIPFQVKGRSGNSSNVFEVYDNAGTPALKFGVTAAGIPFIPVGTLSCGLGTAGQMLVDAATLQICDNQGTPALKRMALGDSSGNALAGDSATGFFPTGNLELTRLPVGAANQLLGTDSGATTQEHKTLAVGAAGTDFAIAHATNLITFNLPDASTTARGAVTTGPQTFAGNKTFNGSVAIGAGTAITKHLSATASLDFGSVAANSCSTLTITVTGAADGNVIALGVPNALASTAGLVFDSFVSAADTVTVKACNVTTSASVDPASATVRADVWQH